MKRRDLLKEMWDLCRREESSDGEYEDDYESEDDDDMMMPDEDAVRDDQADSTAERDEEAQRQAQVREIAEQKMGDMNAVDVDGAMAMVRGSARAMGLDVVEG